MKRLTCILILVLCGAVAAQGPATLVKKVLLPGESIPAARRLEAIDLLVQPEPAAEGVVQTWGLAAGPSGSLASFVATAAEQINLQKWPQAMTEYQQLLGEAGDALAPILSGADSHFVRSVQLRRLCQQRLADAPPSVRDLHRR